MADLSDKELAASYGWALATMNSVPELKKLFQTAVKKQYTPERFIAEMRNLKWFKAQSEAQRKFLVLKTADPAQYVAQVKATMATLADEYSSATGLIATFKPPTLKNGKVVEGSGFLYSSATSALQFGLNEAQIKDRLYRSVDWKHTITEGSLGGTLSGEVMQMRQQASDLGIAPSDDYFGNMIGRIALGNDSPEGALANMRKLAKERYSAYADRIDAGETMADISQGYRESVAKVLEINPGSVDVFDKNVQSALTARNANGDATPTSINDFEDGLRKDTRWQYTQNAKETLMSAGQNVLKSFGLVA